MKSFFFALIFFFGLHFKFFAQHNIESLLRDVHYELIEGVSVDSIHETEFIPVPYGDKFDTIFINLYFNDSNEIEKKNMDTNQNIWNFLVIKKDGQIDSTVSIMISKHKHLIHRTVRHHTYDENKNLVKIIKDLKISAEGIENYSKSRNVILIKRDSLGLPIEYLDTVYYVGNRVHEKAEYDFENEIVYIRKYNNKRIVREVNFDFDVNSKKIKSYDYQHFNKKKLMVFEENAHRGFFYYRYSYDEIGNWIYKTKYYFNMYPRGEEKSISIKDVTSREIFYTK